MIENVKRGFLLREEKLDDLIKHIRETDELSDYWHRISTSLIDKHYYSLVGDMNSIPE